MALARSILEYLADLESVGVVSMVRFAELAEALECSPEQAYNEAYRLAEDDFIDAEFSMVSSGAQHWSMVSPRMLAKASRELGLWPPESPYEDLVGVIGQAIADAETAEERSRLEKLLGAVGDVGKGTATVLLSSFLQHRFGI